MAAPSNIEPMSGQMTEASGEAESATPPFSPIASRR
jgi:hypothetical protein